MIKTIDFKDKKILVITDDIKQHVKIQFGIRRAKLILANIEAIADFVKDNEQPVHE